MQTINSTMANISPQVQSILPVLARLSIEERFSVIGFLANQTVNPQTTTAPKKLSPLDRQYLKGAIISDDFYDDLGDEFWLGKDA